MSGSRTLWLALLFAAAFTWGILHLLGVQFSAGDVYPDYSSLRTDPMGSKLLFDSLARMPGLTVTRSFLPFDYLQPTHATVLVLATPPASLGKEEFRDSLRKLAERGNRAVAALSAAAGEDDGDLKTLQNAWHVRIVSANGPHARGLYFADAKDWTVLDRAGEKLFAIERGFGSGQVVLYADSDPFANGSTIAMDRLAQVSAAIGTNASVIFDEAHFGIVESGSVVGLARRYRMMGLALGLAICAALLLWRNASAFPLPTASPEPERLWGRTSFAGLVTLLRRHIPPRELAPVCWQEWLRTNRNQVTPERAQRAAALAGAAADRPLEAVREIQAVVHAKGEL